MDASVANVQNERYGAIDGLRAFAAIGVAIMHIKENGFTIPGFISESIIGEMGNFVYLFMVVSGFAMCCGYYEKIINNKISITEFYKKRFIKIWPYFALLCLIDVAVSPSIEALYELFADLTLCFGLLPNANISVIGVGWFIGLVFVFYMIFPFFCFLLSDKRRAWCSFCAALIFNILCQNYFMNSEHVVKGYDMRGNIIYCSVFFLIGGLIYLYREKIAQAIREAQGIVLIACILSVVAYLYIGKSVFTLLILNGLFLSYAIGVSYRGGVLRNSAVHFISGISMEIYLSHMLFYRIFERMYLTHLFSNEVVSYIFTAVTVLATTIVFAKTFQLALNKMIKLANCKQ